MGISCCNKNEEKKYATEEFIFVVVSNLKICRYSYPEIKSLLYSAMHKKIRIKKEIIKKPLSDIFYDQTILNNDYFEIHEKIFEEYFYLLNDTVNLYDIIFYAFPLLNKTKYEEHNEMSFILTNLLGEYYSHTELYLLFVRVFEFYTFKITKVIEYSTIDVDLKYNLVTLGKTYFTFHNIELRVLEFLKKFEKGSLEEKMINFGDFRNTYRNKGLFNFNNIRDYVIKLLEIN